MAVKLRLARAGAKKRPIYRVVVADQRSPRDGRFIEHIGQYDPGKDPGGFQIDTKRLDHWLSVGARPTQTLQRLIAKQRQAAGG